MRIAIAGAHGVGKTTLAAEFSRLLALPILPTPGRTLAAKGLPVNKQATVASQLVAWLLQFRLERERASWVSSRSLVDVWAYAALAAERTELDAVGRAQMGELAAATPLAMRERYDKLVYVPPRLPLQADDVRSDDAEFQRLTDERIRCAIWEWQLPHASVDVRDRDAVEALLESVRRAASQTLA